MDFLQLFLIAVLQGLLEWLPISSEGQIALVMLHVFNITDLSTILSLIIWLHLGTAFSALIKYRVEYFRVLFPKTDEKKVEIILTEIILVKLEEIMG